MNKSLTSSAAALAVVVALAGCGRESAAPAAASASGAAPASTPVAGAGGAPVSVSSVRAVAKNVEVMLEATGTISNFVSVASFTVAGVSVDASTATFKDGSAADLRNGATVEIKGTLTAGVVRATSVEFRSVTTTPPTGGNGTPFEATGSITDFVSLASFRVGGVLIDGSSATFVDGTASDLRNGALIEVNGTLVNGVVRATRIEIKSSSNPGTPSDGTEFEASGTVSSYVSVASFSLGSVVIDASSASFERGTTGDLRNGVAVEVRGTWRGGKVIANRVRFER